MDGGIEPGVPGHLPGRPGSLEADGNQGPTPARLPSQTRAGWSWTRHRNPPRSRSAAAACSANVNALVTRIRVVSSTAMPCVASPPSSPAPVPGWSSQPARAHSGLGSATPGRSGCRPRPAGAGPERAAPCRAGPRRSVRGRSRTSWRSVRHPPGPCAAPTPGATAVSGVTGIANFWHPFGVLGHRPYASFCPG
jgi:hypothetical protein